VLSNFVSLWSRAGQDDRHLSRCLSAKIDLSHTGDGKGGGDPDLVEEKPLKPPR
jgi:hypothetical protein